MLLESSESSSISQKYKKEIADNHANFFFTLYLYHLFLGLSAPIVLLTVLCTRPK